MNGIFGTDPPRGAVPPRQGGRSWGRLTRGSRHVAWAPRRQPRALRLSPSGAGITGMIGHYEKEHTAAREGICGGMRYESHRRSGEPIKTPSQTLQQAAGHDLLSATPSSRGSRHVAGAPRRQPRALRLSPSGAWGRLTRGSRHVAGAPRRQPRTAGFQLP